MRAAVIAAPSSSSRAALILLVVAATLFSGLNRMLAASAFTTNTFRFTYADRDALFADGWSFLATSPSGAPRDTEATNSTAEAISFDQAAHPGTLRIPANGGDLWADLNNSVNTLFHSLSSNWVSVRLEVADFQPTWNYQQVQLGLYQDDDNYLEIGRGFNGSQAGENVQLTREDGGVLGSYSPQTVAFTNFSATAFLLRLDRNTNTEMVTAFYSENGTEWLLLGGSSHALVNPQLCIWAGGSVDAGPACELRRLDIVTTTTALKPALVAQPQNLVFSTVAGQACTNIQQVRVKALRSAAPVSFTVSKTGSWLNASIPSGNNLTPGYCNVSVSAASLAVGTYKGTVTCSASGVTAVTANVTLIVNPSTPPVRVATWRGAKAGAMSVWVDDSDLSGFDLLVSSGFQGTYVLWDVTPVPQAFTSYYAAGMELGSHTVEHPCVLLNEPRARFNFETNIASICSQTPQVPANLISMAYPCGVTTNTMQGVAADYYLVARGYNINQLEDASPYNFMNLKSFNSHEHEAPLYNPSAPANPDDFKPLVDAAITQGKWFNLVLHTMNNDDGAIAYAVGKDIWVGTGGAVTKYILQRDRTVITNYVKTTPSLKFDCYRLPLPSSALRSFETAIDAQDLVTFQVNLAGLGPVSRVTMSGASLPFTSQVAGGKTNLLVNAPVTLSRQTITLLLSNSPPVLPAQPDQIAAALVTLVVTNSATDYDVPAQTLTYTLLNPPAGAQIDSTGVIRWTPTDAQSPGTYVIRTKVSDNYTTALSATNSFTVTVKGLLSVTANSQSRTYGASNPTLTGTVSGVLAGDDITASYSTTATDSSPVGTYSIVPALIDPNGRSTNYVVVMTNGSLTITPAVLTVTASGINRVYNATPGATVTLADNRRAGDTLTASYTSATFANKNVGDGKAVTVTGIAINGPAAGNYTLASPITTTTANISKASLTVHAAGVSRPYDGTTSATVTLSDNRLVGDSLQSTSAAATFATKHVGTGKAISVSGISISGTDADNYQLTSTTASTSANVTPRAITVSAAVDSKQYDGSTTSVALPTVTSGSLAGGDVGTFTQHFADKNAGTGKTLTPSGSISDGNSGANYTVTWGTSAFGAITPRPLVVSATAQNKAYDQTTGAVVSLTDDRVPGDVLVTTYTNAAFSDATATTNKQVQVTGIALSGDDSGNYSCNSTASTTADITPATLSVTADDKIRAYGESNPQLTGTLHGMLDGDNITASYSTAATAGSAVGSYAITPVLIDPNGNLTNYAVSTTNGALTITQALLTITAAGVNREYDATQDATVTLTDNRRAGDTFTASYTSATFATKHVGTGKAISVSGIAISGTDTVNYQLTSTTVSTSGTITPRPLAVIATAQNKVYDGTTAAAVGLTDNRLPDDVLSATCTNAAFSDATAGTNKLVQVSGITLSGLDAGNYSCNEAASAAADITPAVLTVTADNKTRPYGEPNPQLTGTLLGVQGSDNLTATYLTAAQTNSPVGEYAITPSITDPDGKLVNYTLQEEPGLLTIAPINTTLGLQRTASLLSTGSDASFTATVTATVSTYEPPTGTIQFFLNGMALGSPVVLHHGVANISSVALAAGTNEIVAIYPGDGNFLGSTNSLLQEVAPAPERATIVDIRRAGDGTLTVVFAGTPGANYVVEASSEAAFSSTVDVSTNAAQADGRWTFIEPADQPVRFYRVRNR